MVHPVDKAVHLRLASVSVCLMVHPVDKAVQFEISIGECVSDGTPCGQGCPV